MRRLALPAVIACLVTLTLPTAVRALSGEASEASCPPGPGRVASHTGIRPSLDGLTAGIGFALSGGCDDVELSLLSYQLAPGSGARDEPRPVLYDVTTATVSAGEVNNLEVAIMPGCWSLVKLVAGRPPGGPAAARARIESWERRNTILSKWNGETSTCSPTPPSSPIGEDGLLGSLLDPPGRDDTAAGGDTATTGQPGPAATRPPRRSQPPPTSGADGAGEPEAAIEGGGTGSGDGTGEEAAGAEGGRTAPPGDEAGAPEEGALAADQAGKEATDGGSLPLTGTPADGIMLAGTSLVVIGLVLLRLGRRYRARHLAT